jgi:hypothetical protein
MDTMSGFDVGASGVGWERRPFNRSNASDVPVYLLGMIGWRMHQAQPMATALTLQQSLR